MNKLTVVAGLALVFTGSVAFGQEQTKKTETGALSFSTDGGTAFGFPSVRAAVVMPGVGNAISPKRQRSPAWGSERH